MCGDKMKKNQNRLRSEFGTVLEGSSLILDWTYLHVGSDEDCLTYEATLV